MDSSPSSDSVYLAIVTLYHNHNSSEKERASKWLGELQKSVFSWKVANDLLQEKRDLESCYFAAQTLRTKIQYSFHELPLESHISLRDSLIQHLEQVNEQTSSVIVTQLCLALAILSLQMATWKNPVLDLMSRFGERSAWPLLEVLILLPEEVTSDTLRLGDNRRHEILNELTSCSGTVLEYLKMCLANSDSPQIHIKVLRCFTSWVSIQAIPFTDVSNNVIVIHAFNILRDHQAHQELHDVATDSISKLLLTLEDNNNQLVLEEQLFRGVVALEESYHMAVAHEDDEKCMNYCRIFTELGESLLDKIIKSSSEHEPHYAIKILDLILMCVGHHDFEIAEITFNLWYRLSEELYHLDDELLNFVFRPYIERLLQSLCRHSRMDPDHEGPLDDAEDFAYFRRKVTDLIKDIVFIVGSSNCLREMFLCLQAPGVTWDTIEAALYTMQAIARFITLRDYDMVFQVIKAILALNPETSHIAVRHTAILLLGEFSEWINIHSEQLLVPVFYYLLYCLRQPQLSTVAAKALQPICSASRFKLTDHFNALALHTVETINSPNLSSEAAVTLLKGVAAILPTIPPGDIYSAMKNLCWIQMEPLQKLTAAGVEYKEGTNTDPAIYLDRVAAIFRHTKFAPIPNTANPGVHVLSEMWPILSQTLNKYQTDVRVMERCCRCLRFAIRSTGRYSSHLLQPIVEQIVPLYSIYKYSCFLYLGSIIVDEYALDEQCVPGLLKMLQAFIRPTFEVLQEENGLRDHPDMVDDFFRLCARFLQRIPIEFLNCPAVVGILQCALTACSLDHSDASASTMKFFYDLIGCGRNYKDRPDFEDRRKLVNAIIQNHGEQLVCNLIRASVFSLRTYKLSGVADVLMELRDTDTVAVSQWLETALKNLPTQNSGGAAIATQAQLEEFHQVIIGAKTWKELTQALKDFTRLYSLSEDANDIKTAKMLYAIPKSLRNFLAHYVKE